MASLTLIKQPNPSVSALAVPEVTVLCKAETLIGRHPREVGIDVTLMDVNISRRHAKIVHTEGDYWIEDLKSRNGIRLNNVRITERAALTDGDVIGLCGYTFHFCDGGDPIRPITIRAEWLTDTVRALAGHMSESGDLSAMPILADALQDADCGDDQLLGHCRNHAPHVRGCWALNLVLGRG